MAAEPDAELIGGTCLAGELQGTSAGAGPVNWGVQGIGICGTCYFVYVWVGGGSNRNVQMGKSLLGLLGPHPLGPERRGRGRDP